MGKKIIFQGHTSKIEAVFASWPGHTKTKTDAGYLETTSETLDPEIAKLLERLRAGSMLSQDDARRIVRLIDFVAVAAPDNVTRFWDPDVLALASKLRQDYARVYGEKVYD